MEEAQLEDLVTEILLALRVATLVLRYRVAMELADLLTTLYVQEVLAMEVHLHHVGAKDMEAVVAGGVVPEVEIAEVAVVVAAMYYLGYKTYQCQMA
jgi:hypothetical protein